MTLPEGKDVRSACDETAAGSNCQRKYRWLWLGFPVVGLLALVWFLIRVVPKPSRAMYPCQKVAAPLAGGFLLWIAGVVASAFAYRKTRDLIYQSRLRLAAVCLGITAVLAVVALMNMPQSPLLADPPVANDPIGEARGNNPGRVVWVHDADATSWTTGVGHWWQPAYTNQNIVDDMLERTICGLVGTPNLTEAWNKLFKYSNLSQGKGDVGYTPGEKIMIKVNLVGQIAWNDPWDYVDDLSWNIKAYKIDYMNTSPQIMLALLDQLVNVVGVNQSDITIGDPVCNFANEYYSYLAGLFPNVKYLDYEYSLPGCPAGRTPVVKSSGVPIYWSGPGSISENVPTCYTQAAYMINLANLKSHDTNGGITVCGKNHYGTMGRGPIEGGYYDLHASLPIAVLGFGHYRAIVDFMGHTHIGGKTMLYLIDGLYAGRHPKDPQYPEVWDTCPPFNSEATGGIGPDWTSCILASQDGVAIDSVAYDMLYTEWPEAAGAGMSGSDDYLTEAALADNPPSGTFYDPNHAGNVTRMTSQGVHEHWNNIYDKRYSRNLGINNGIELAALTTQEMLTVRPVEPGTITIDGDPSDWNLGEFGTLSRGGQGEMGDIGAVGWIDGTFYAGCISDRVEWGFTYGYPTNATDHAVRFYSRHDLAYQYFLVRSDDDIIWTARTYNFENDCAEFFIDPGRYRSTTPMWGSTTNSGPFELVIDAKNERSVAETSSAYRAQILAGVESAVSVDATGWWLEVRIAKNATNPPLPAAGTFGVNINFRDQDENLGYPSLYGWSDDYLTEYWDGVGRFPDKIPHSFGNVFNGYQISEDPPLIVEVSPDPDPVIEGEEYVVQLALLEGAPPVTWSVLTGPDDLDITQTGYVHLWTPTESDVGIPVLIEVQAQNPYGTDTESWYACPQSHCVLYDFDLDDDVDMDDFGVLQRCFSGAGIPQQDPACLIADIEPIIGDKDVDQADLNRFLPCMSGPAVQVSTTCGM